MYKILLKSVMMFLAMAALLPVAGCNKTRVITTIDPAKPLAGTTVHDTIVLMPLADYSSGTTPDRAARRQGKSLAAVSHGLLSLGLMPAVQEDVYAYLFTHGLISPVQTSLNEYNSGKWSAFVNSATDAILAGGEQNEVHNIVGFTPETIQEIGVTFSARYVLRGRIIEYGIREDTTYNPLRRGILPFFADGTTTGLFGIARTSEYDLWQETATMGTIGAVIGDNSASPWLDSTGAHGWDAAFWGAVAAGYTYLAHNGGAVPEARIQLQLALQSTTDGRILWTNRAEVAVTPETAYDRSDQHHLMDTGLEEVASILVADMGRNVFGIEPQLPLSDTEQENTVSEPLSPLSNENENVSPYPPLHGE